MQDVVFERRVGALRLTGLGLLALSAPAVLGAVLRWEAPLLDALDPVSQAFGRGPVLGSVITLSLAPLAALLVAVVVVSRRFGRCVAGPDWLVFERALLPTWVGRTVALRSELHDREPRADVVRVWLRGQRRNMPFVVPASTQAELEAALLELDREVDVEPVAAGRRHGPRDRWTEAAILAVMYALSVTTMLVLERRFGEEWALPSLLGLVAFSLPLVLCLSAARAPWIRRVYVGRAGLAVGEELYTWDELTVVGVGEGHLAVAAGSRTCLAKIGADDEVKVREAIAARLTAADRPVDEVLGPLPASVAGWRRRVRVAMQAAPAVLVPVGVLVAACVAPNLVRVRATDDYEQVLHVVHARDGDRPLALVLVTLDAPVPVSIRSAGWWPQTLSEPDAALLVDLGRGTVRGPGLQAEFEPGATFVHVARSVVVSARPVWEKIDDIEPDGYAVLGEVLNSAPQLIDVLAGTEGEGVVDLAANGWTTRRCFRTNDETEHLVWAVDRGEVKFVVRAPFATVWNASPDGVFSYLRNPKTWSWVTPEDALGVFVDGSGTRPDSTLPTSHADLLEVRRRVDAGERLADVLTR